MIMERMGGGGAGVKSLGESNVERPGRGTRGEGDREGVPEYATEHHIFNFMENFSKLFSKIHNLC